MFKRRIALSWMDVESAEFVEWAHPYLLNHGRLLGHSHLPSKEAILAFRNQFLVAPPTANAEDQLFVRNFKQAWKRRQDRKSTKGQKKPYSLEMSTRVHDKLKTIAKERGLSIYKTVELLILDADGLRAEMRKERKEESAKVQAKPSTPDIQGQKKSNEIAALKAKLASCEKEAEKLVYDIAKYWLVLQANGLTDSTDNVSLSPDQKAKAEELKSTLLQSYLKDVESNLGAHRLNLPRTPLSPASTPSIDSPT